MSRALRLLVTRAADDAAAWSRELRARGHEPLELPCVSIEELVPPPWAAEAARAADWLVFSSPRAVDLWRRLDLVSPARVAAVGARTAARVEEWRDHCELVASPENGHALAAALRERWAALGAPASWSLVAPGALDGDRSLEALAPEGGWRVQRIALYRTLAAAPRAPRVDLNGWCLDAVLLASPSAVAGLVAQAELPRGVALVCIGPSTAAAAARIDGAHVLEATRADLEGLLATLPTPLHR